MTADSHVATRQSFLRLLDLEQRRSERSGRKFVLLLIDAPALLGGSGRLADNIIAVLSASTRDTDIKGWFKEKATLGVIFTELGLDQGQSAATFLRDKVSSALAGVLTSEQMAQVRLIWFLLPEDWNRNNMGEVWDAVCPHRHGKRRLARLAKRSIDIAGSVVALLIFAPLLAVIAAAIKCSSAGPVLFRQKRLGQYGRSFIFLKFRSMLEKSDPKIHEEYVKRLISGDPAVQQRNNTGKPVYKITDDPRVTRIGRLLRRSSLDEVPQFLNVLWGTMSLVGPRPPVPYEVENYDPWHRRRLLEAKPGITGLWQVHGRSRTTFDEMVRLDLRYARTWSIWLDLKIILQTPWAVVMGSGAY